MYIEAVLLERVVQQQCSWNVCYSNVHGVYNDGTDNVHRAYNTAIAIFMEHVDTAMTMLISSTAKAVIMKRVQQQCS